MDWESSDFLALPLALPGGFLRLFSSWSRAPVGRAIPAGRATPVGIVTPGDESDGMNKNMNRRESQKNEGHPQ